MFPKDTYFSVRMTPESFSRKALLELAHYRMPYGRYRGRYLTKLPLPYLVWFRRRGFPDGKLGRLLESTLAVKENGLEGLISHIRKEFRPDNP